MLKKDRVRFSKAANDIVFAAGPDTYKPMSSANEYEFEGTNPLHVTVFAEGGQNWSFSVCTRFGANVPELDMNRYSFKYNFRTEMPVDMAIESFKSWFARALSHVGRKIENL